MVSLQIKRWRRAHKICPSLVESKRVEGVLHVLSKSVIREAKDQVHLVRFASQLFRKSEATDGVEYANHSAIYLSFVC